MTYLLIALLVLFVWCRVIWFEMWEHLDSTGKSYYAHFLNLDTTGYVPTDVSWTFFKLGFTNSHKLVKDWFVGDRPLPWVTDFLWEDFEEGSD